MTPPADPAVETVPVEEAVGRRLLYDMTQIFPGRAKGPAFREGQTISAGDICRLQRMGRRHIHVGEADSHQAGWVHESQAALAFAEAMAGAGVTFQTPLREGKITLKADRDGLLVVDHRRLMAFNTHEGVMCASCRQFVVLKKGAPIAATRAIPLYLSESDFIEALAVLAEGPLFRVDRFSPARVGILVTGSEIYDGLVEDRFIPIIGEKVERFGCEVVHTGIVPDDRAAIRESLCAMLAGGAQLIVTTAGLSVDPDDVTRQGMIDAGCRDLVYGAPILPGAMTFLARLGAAVVIGVPASGLYHPTTSFDLLLPRILAGHAMDRMELAPMGYGGFCEECPDCTYPHCAFGS